MSSFERISLRNETFKFLKGDFMRLSGVFFGITLALVSIGASVGLSADSSQDARAMTAVVQSSKAAMIRVPVDQAGRELVSEAQLRVVNEEVSKTELQRLQEVWNKGVDVSQAPVADSSTANDSSSRGFFWGWNAWRWSNVGWYSPYYYYGYWPTYYYDGYTYGYGSPYYYHYYNPYYYGVYPAWGYRYYYYPASW